MPLVILIDTCFIPQSDTRSFVLLRQSQSCSVEGEEMKGGPLEKESLCPKKKKKGKAFWRTRKTTHSSLQSPDQLTHSTTGYMRHLLGSTLRISLRSRSLHILSLSPHLSLPLPFIPPTLTHTHTYGAHKSFDSVIVTDWKSEQR